MYIFLYCFSPFYLKWYTLHIEKINIKKKINVSHFPLTIWGSLDRLCKLSFTFNKTVGKLGFCFNITDKSHGIQTGIVNIYHENCYIYAKMAEEKLQIVSSNMI